MFLSVTAARWVLLLREADSLPYGVRWCVKVAAANPIPCRGGYYPPAKKANISSRSRLRGGY